MKRYGRKDPKYPVPKVPHLLIALDLGKWKVGVAVFLCPGAEGPESGHLVGAEVIHIEGEWSAEKMADAIHASLSKLLDFTGFLPTIMVCEWPMKYATARKFHESLDRLYEVGHATVRRFGTSWADTYSPSEWKGNVPKKAHKRRLVRELTLLEKATLQKHTAASLGVSDKEAQEYLDKEESHDLWDAVGIGLFATARTRKGGTRV
jgi:hypothetical protein